MPFISNIGPLMQKLGHLDGSNWVAHTYPAVYQLPEEPEPERLIVGVPAGGAEVFGKLVECLAPPFYLLYVLHTPRGEGLPGRYQSPAVEATQLREFLEQFSQYLSSDARFDIWAYSPGANATLVWDRHNRIFAYGPLARYKFVLESLGFCEGRVEVPTPHAHNYHAEFDKQAARVLEAFEWHHTPLREKDEQ